MFAHRLQADGELSTQLFAKLVLGQMTTVISNCVIFTPKECVQLSKYCVLFHTCWMNTSCKYTPADLLIAKALLG